MLWLSIVSVDYYDTGHHDYDLNSAGLQLMHCENENRINVFLVKKQQ